ncbi:MAG: gamma carbonic anhydrase family protein [Pseudomonadota bacterium]
MCEGTAPKPARRTSALIPYNGILPTIADSAFIADTARVTGDLVIGEQSSLWYGVVARGDVNVIRIGQRSNIQDGSVIHVSSAGIGTYIGDDVTVGHMALIHACTIGDGAFIGMKACVMDGSVVEAGAMVAAGALVTPGKTIPSGQLWTGSPARYWRDLTDDEKQMMADTSARYVRLAGDYLSNAPG